jgi:hypothetical protein
MTFYIFIIKTDLIARKFMECHKKFDRIVFFLLQSIIGVTRDFLTILGFINTSTTALFLSGVHKIENQGDAKLYGRR